MVMWPHYDVSRILRAIILDPLFCNQVDVIGLMLIENLNNTYMLFATHTRFAIVAMCNYFNFDRIAAGLCKCVYSCHPLWQATKCDMSTTKCVIISNQIQQK
jgi:hypothetical protein